MNRYSLFFVMLFFLFFDCGRKTPNNTDDTATFGAISIASDEAYKPIVDAELDVFHALYKYAKIKVSYSSEGEAFNLLIKDSVRLIFSTRQLNAPELAYFEKKKIFPRINKIAIDGAALIVNNSNPDSLLTMKQLEAIFKGDQQSFNKIVIDNNNSSNLRFLREKFNLTTLTSQIYSAGSNEAVVDYIKQDKKAIGVIGVNWISDSDDSTTRSFMKEVKVVAISSKEKPTSSGEYFQPYQAYLATDQYPLARNLFIISREARVGLGTGFASFVASDRGQRIILKSGLVPATVPLRIITTTNKPL